ncbi:MAG: hypothetical protein MZV64_52955 [Ignavibacteriales bacterium]|nr:hypothetical protein [Ignavibacteriales bacterium]
MGEYLRPVQLDELRSLRPALIGGKIQPEALGRPDEHQHDAGVDGAHEGVFGRQDPRPGHVIAEERKSPSPARFPSGRAPHVRLSRSRSSS